MNIERGGHTVVLRGPIAVNAVRVNYVKMGIAEAGDDVFDHKVFLRIGI